MSASTCAECGTEFAGRADAAYCYCRQQAYLNRNDPARPVAVGDKDMFRDRFKGYTGPDDRDEYANFLVEFLGPALDRAGELLELLIRRSRERDALGI